MPAAPEAATSFRSRPVARPAPSYRITSSLGAVLSAFLAGVSMRRVANSRDIAGTC